MLMACQAADCDKNEQGDHQAEWAQDESEQNNRTNDDGQDFEIKAAAVMTAVTKSNKYVTLLHCCTVRLRLAAYQGQPNLFPHLIGSKWGES